jgi:hypothetical protein
LPKRYTLRKICNTPRPNSGNTFQARYLRAYYLSSCQKGFAETTEAQGQQGWRSAGVHLHFSSHDRAIAPARDARAVIVVGLEKRVPLLLKARVEPT